MNTMGPGSMNIAYGYGVPDDHDGFPTITVNNILKTNHRHPIRLSTISANTDEHPKTDFR